jgi:hypothetical protein
VEPGATVIDDWRTLVITKGTLDPGM